ncbi:MAG: hypothetical protein RLZZ301_969 [Bacteroidota bacterium]|jgi:triosephosphate isomerase
MQKKILAANWKMNLLQPEVQQWLQSYQALQWASSSCEVRVYPSSVYLSTMTDLLPHVGAQNVHTQPKGAFTGELSIAQLKSCGVKSVLIGHSERRTLFHEDSSLIQEKVAACSSEAFEFIFCCGESLESRQAATHVSDVIAQLDAELTVLTSELLPLISIAYEPIWAIGSGLSANTEQINEMHDAIREWLLARFGQAAASVCILYGGSCTPENAAEIFACPNVNGGLIGGASLDADRFYELFQLLCA